MSKQELVEAYVEGRLTRRTFVRRLVAVGITLSAASAYAAALAPKAVAGGGEDDLYEDFYKFYCEQLKQGTEGGTEAEKEAGELAKEACEKAFGL